MADPKYFVRRLLALVMLVMMLGSGSLGLCWCTLFDAHDCDDHADSQAQIVQVATDCCTCELCNCCGQGVPAMVVTAVSHEVPMQPVAIAADSSASRMRNLADEIFIPPKIS